MIKIKKKIEVLKYIIDTNVLFSGLYSSESNAGKLLKLAIERKIILFAPEMVKEELKRNLVKKLNYNEKEINFTIKALPIRWIEKDNYQRYLEKPEKIISKKDSHILALSFLKKYDIITGDKEFFELKHISVKSLREIIDYYEK